MGVTLVDLVLVHRLPHARLRLDTRGKRGAEGHARSLVTVGGRRVAIGSPLLWHVCGCHHLSDAGRVAERLTRRLQIAWCPGSGCNGCNARQSDGGESRGGAVDATERVRVGRATCAPLTDWRGGSAAGKAAARATGDAVATQRLQKRLDQPTSGLVAAPAALNRCVGGASAAARGGDAAGSRQLEESLRPTFRRARPAKTARAAGQSGSRRGGLFLRPAAGCRRAQLAALLRGCLRLALRRPLEQSHPRGQVWASLLATRLIAPRRLANLADVASRDVAAVVRRDHGDGTGTLPLLPGIGKGQTRTPPTRDRLHHLGRLALQPQVAGGWARPRATRLQLCELRLLCGAPLRLRLRL